jgi:hypothetical protein
MKHTTIKHADRKLALEFALEAKSWTGHVFISDRELAEIAKVRQLRSGKHDGVDCLAAAFDDFGTTYLLRDGRTIQLLAGETI